MIELKIEGMTCNHCLMSVRKALEGVAGVREAKVDLASGQANVTGDIDAGSLVAAVESTGYRASAAS